MNIKLSIDRLELLVDRKIFSGQFLKQISTYASRAGLEFPEPQIGAGYMQWNLPGEGWCPFATCPQADRDVVAREYGRRRANLKAALGNTPLTDRILTVPADEYVYCCYRAGRLCIALVAWGCRFPDTPGAGELTTYVAKETLQNVRIGFRWDGRLLPDFCFKLNGQPRRTAGDGFFCVDRPMAVGASYPVETGFGTGYTLSVESDRADYLYDLTQYFDVCVSVRQDGKPLSDKDCTVLFDGSSHRVRTDESGFATLRLPLAGHMGLPAEVQPECAVSCDAESRRQTPAVADERLLFAFDLVGERPVVPESAAAPGPVEEPRPDPIPEPQFVYIHLEDYGGYPLAELDFTLKTKSKGDLSLRTDANGCCAVPEEWMSDKERFEVSFTVTPAYRQAHDIHRKKSKKQRR